ncbi:protein takeout-like [Belonocnema kinseyi]|uniref:protein takeout-like n=1 Tax=Belonocnema kinseyi TaxID=2817044 RepID=UPI00143DBDDD|nr:protein takeout-like [Belonocnema kinseyi]
MNAVAGLFLIAFATVTARDLPSNFKTCQRSDPQFNECLSRAVADAVAKLGQGSRTFRILPLEPLKVNSISIGSTEGSVSLKQEYQNVELHGLTRGLEPRKLTTDWDRNIFVYDSYHPKIDFVGNYKIDGKVLLLPIRGNGHSNITMLHLKTRSTMYFEKYEKDGEAYMKIKQFNVKFSPEKVLLRFDNLFDGDPVLAKPMENFISENSDLLFKELQLPYEKSFGLVFAQIGNELFNRVPVNKIFPE